MKTKLYILFSLLFISNSWAQTVFTENLGNPSSTTTIGSNTFQNSGLLTYSNGSQSTSADIRNTNASSGYTDASAGGNVYFSATSGAYGFSIEGINASSYTSLTLQYAYRKESASLLATFSVDYWNGSSWTALANTSGTLFNESATATAKWYTAKNLSLPVDAQINGLKLRFVKTGTTAIRIDDIKLTGTATAPTVLNIPASNISTDSTTFSGSVTGGTGISATGTVYSVTATNASPILGGTGVYTINSTNPGTGTGTFANNSGNVLSPNVQYSYSAFATNSASITGYSNISTFYTLALSPSAPVVNGATATSLNITIGSDSNPPITKYAIFEVTTGKYLQSDGALGTTAVYQTAGIWGTTTITNLSSSTLYTFEVVAKNGAEIQTAYSPSTSETTLTGIPPSGQSDIVFNSNSSASTNSNIDYTLYQGTTLTNTGTGTNGSAGVMGFYLRDGGAGLTDSDSFPTELTEISFTVTNAANIRSARLFVGSSPRGAAVTLTGSSTLVFTGLTNIIAADNAQLAINLRVTFNTTVADNEQMQFTVLSATAKTGGSIFATTNGGTAVSSITGDINKIEVTADRLGFIQQPPVNIVTNTNMVPSPSIEAVDINGNRDYDFSGNISVISSGALSNSPQTSPAVSGLATFNAISHITSGAGLVITANGSGLISSDSAPFDVLSVPSFTPIQPICYGDTSAVLPTTSLNGISGTWAPQLDTTVDSTYTFTPDIGQLATTTTMPITINYGTTPSFAEVLAICPGTTLSALPTTSLEGITGTWSPELNNQETTTYVFTPDSGQCASQGTLTIDVEPVTIPEFPEFEPVCQGGYIEPLPLITNNGITGTWLPTLNNSETTTYTFTPDDGQCAAQGELTIIVNPIITPTFEEIAPICSGSAIDVLSNISLEGITGTWSPDFNFNQTTNYIFTPDEGQCAGSANVTVVVNPSITPEFANVNAICTGEVLNPLPTTSLNGITGTWSPEIDNTVTTTYTFTPDDGPCALITNLTIVVNPNIPTFTPVASICVGENLNELPTTSLNGITGAWSPEINSEETTTYTFTPDEGQCASITTLTIDVGHSTPVFDDLQSICVSTALSELPALSDNGVKGGWSANTNSAGDIVSYTFTPVAGQCATGNVINIPAGQKVIPAFDPMDPVLSGSVIADLPNISNNGISGTWSPELNNTETTIYTFTPSEGQCAEIATLTIEVLSENNRELMASSFDSVLLSATSSQTSNEVGYIPGDLSVSNSGSAIYNVPIEVPPGINGVAPKIGLAYNSQGGVGMAGYGWNIVGLSAITRIASTRFHDDLIDPVDFDSNDRYALDGQRLILKTGTYGTANSTYETETFSNTKITFTGTYFKVEYADGAVAYYGQTADSKVGTLTYALSYWQNPQGLRISYSYTQSTNTAYINTVRYGATGNNSINEVQFIYKNRFRSEEGYAGGMNIINSKILSEIRVKGYNNTGYRNYTLAHETVLGYERLIKITEKNGDNSKSYTPTVFEYPELDSSNTISRFRKPHFFGNDLSGGFGYNFNTSPPSISFSFDFDTHFIVNGDFDGDGDQDFIYKNKLYTHFSDDESTPIIEDFSALISSGFGETMTRVPVKILIGSPSDFKLLNRDAWCVEDFSSNTPPNTPINIRYTIFSKNSSINVEYVKETQVTTINKRYLQTFTGDFNGDGLTDKLILNHLSNSNYHDGEFYFVDLDKRLTTNYTKYLGNLFGLTSSGVDHNGSYGDSYNYTTHVYVADFNGDGKSDIITFNGNENKIKVYSLNEDNNLILLWQTAFNFIHKNASGVITSICCKLPQKQYSLKVEFY